MTTTLRNIHIAIAVAAFALAAFFGAPPAFAQLGDIPALIRTTIPTGDPDGGRISYSIALGEGRELRITVDAGRLVVTISGAVKDQFKIFRMDEGEFVPLECSAGFLGAIVGTISCRDVLPGTRLVFARKDLVDRLVPEAAAAEEEFFEAGEFAEEEFASDEDIVEEEPSLFDRALDFFGFGEEEEPEEFVDEFDLGVDGEDEFAFEGGEDEFAFEDEGEPAFGEDEFFGAAGEDEFFETEGEEPSFAEATEGEEEPSWLDNAVEGVADFFGFGEEEAAPEEVAEEEEFFEGFEGEEVAADEAMFDEGEFVAEEGEEFVEAPAEEEFARAPEEFAAPEGEAVSVFGEEFAEEGAAPAEETLLPRMLHKVREFAQTVQNKIADVIIKLYVKPLPLTPEAAEPSSAEATAGEEELLLFDESAEFLEEPTEFDSAPAATVNQAFQHFINGLGQ